LTGYTAEIRPFNIKAVGVNVEPLRFKSQYAIVGLRMPKDWKQGEQKEEARQFHCLNLYNLGSVVEEDERRS
jgi:hypothetical protein